jgi:2-keto-4-pentenoate hydratase/2-oxohepta-3-ene-1,7-dioic acid hydratase in catechol pathway
MGADAPEIPLLFLKPPSSVIGPGQAIILPPQSQKVEHEGELAVVIGRRGRWVQAGDATDLVLGYTIANDVTARDLQRRDGQWTRGKGFDTFCPLGPWIDTEFDPADALITTHVNQELRQMASTRDMVFSVRQLIAFITSVMTLLPGDVILTGTPAGIGPLAAGDTVRVEIEELGSLSNPVKAEGQR